MKDNFSQELNKLLINRNSIIKHNMINNTGYIMQGVDFQKKYTHGVPKRVSKAFKDERRISLTFRCFK